MYKLNYDNSIFEYINSYSKEELIDKISVMSEDHRKKEYIREIFVSILHKSNILNAINNLMKNKKTYAMWFSWSQCQDSDYNKYYKKLIEDIKLNKDKYERVFRLFEEEKSSRIFLNILYWRLTLRSSYLVRSFFETENMQYFEPFEKLHGEEIFVDCGGYIGDSTKALLNYVGGVNKVYLYEADDANIEKAKIELADIANIEFRNVGVGEKSEVLCFNNLGSSSSGFVSNGDKQVKIVSLDEDIAEKISFLKMDIEGFEMKALRGCKNHIVNDRPVMAVCLYHNTEDMWEIPLYISNLVEDYDYYIRLYTMYHGEIVFYAVPKERAISKVEK